MNSRSPLQSIASFAHPAMSQLTLHSIYLFGSAGEGTALPSSDVDLFVVLRGAPDEQQRVAIITWLRELASACDGPPIDLAIATEAELLTNGQFRLERASHLVAGDDIRPQLPPTALDGFIRRYSAAPLAYMAILRSGQLIEPPLDYPDPSGNFYGYDSHALPPSGKPAHNIKAFVALVCWIATLRLAHERHVMTASKAESVAGYIAGIGDGWATFVGNVYRHGHDRWHYRVPTDPADRVLLRELCAQALAFENDYLVGYGTIPTS